MTLKQLLDVTPDIVPIHIYKDNNPYEPAIGLIYSDTLRKDDSGFLDSTVTAVGATIHSHVPYLVITVQ